MGGGGPCVLTRMAARILSSISFIFVSMPSSRTAMRLMRSFTMMGLSRSSRERPEFSGVAPSFSRSWPRLMGGGVSDTVALPELVPGMVLW